MTIDITGLYPTLSWWFYLPIGIFVVFVIIGLVRDEFLVCLIIGTGIAMGAAFLVYVAISQAAKEDRTNAVQHALETQLPEYVRWVQDPEAVDTYVGIKDDGTAEEYLVRQVDETDTYTVRLLS